MIPGAPDWLIPKTVGKTKYIQSKTGDASMQTELRRRQAIIYGMSGQPARIKESRTSTGSTTGALEAFFLTSVMPASAMPKPMRGQQVCYSVFDAGGVETEYCFIIDGDDEGEVVYDAGNANTIVCDI